MKMADNSLMTFQNNCESINRNGVEVKDNDHNNKGDGGDGDVTALQIIINKRDDQPQTYGGQMQCGSEVLTQDEAVDGLSAGEIKIEQNDTDEPFELASSIVDNDSASENVLNKCEIEKCSEETVKETEEKSESEKHGKTSCNVHRMSSAGYLAKVLKKRSIKCLNKMQIMEDVREGCNDVQPSSPGHAEQRIEDEKTDNCEAENGFEQKPNEDIEEEPADIEKNEKAKEDHKIKTEVFPEETIVKIEFPNGDNGNEETYSNHSSPSDSNKRKSESDNYPIKRLRMEIQENFTSRDKILHEFIEMADCNSIEQIHSFSEQLLVEIKTLNELAKEKEREWNNIIHLKKIKEELLLRMQRKKQVMLISDRSDYVELMNESQSENGDDRPRNSSPQSILKSNINNPQKSALKIPNVNGDKKQRNLFLKQSQQQSLEFNGSLDLRQAKQRPVLDVQSIIADYRQRHPEAVPRRGRRIRNSQSDERGSKMSNIMNFSSLILGSGSQVRQNDVSGELGLLLSSLNNGRIDGPKSSPSDFANQETSFRDMLLQFARLSQSERNEIIQNAIKPPPPYPEVTVHPVPTTTTTAGPTNSLLHGILTKSPSKQTKTSFSPTLARLLTAPERTANAAAPTPTIPGNPAMHPSNMSISEILSTSKARNEITITPVGSEFESTAIKEKTEEEETEDRLVIDETTEENRKSADNGSDTCEEVPPCQGCNQKPAQFVCAGCGNQWYCSRECQVTAWDEHSEVCSG